MHVKQQCIIVIKHMLNQCYDMKMTKTVLASLMIAIYLLTNFLQNISVKWIFEYMISFHRFQKQIWFLKHIIQFFMCCYTFQLYQLYPLSCLCPTQNSYLPKMCDCCFHCSFLREYLQFLNRDQNQSFHNDLTKNVGCIVSSNDIVEVSYVIKTIQNNHNF